MGLFRTFQLFAALIVAAHAEQEGMAVSSSGEQFTVCSDSPIVVKDVSVVCDSPGTYYYGSNKYRNSANCLAGDKAKVNVEIYIADAETLEEAGGAAYVSLSVSGYGNVADKSLYQDAELCSLGTLSASDGGVCPGQGYYSISTSFYWNSVDDDEDENGFVPSLVVGFKSDLNKDVFDLGGANTNKCNGNTFTTWSEGVKASYANALTNFLLSFGILIVVVVAMAFFAMHVWKRQEEDDKESALIDEDFQQKVQMISSNKEVLDF